MSHNLSETNAVTWASVYACRWKLSVAGRGLNSPGACLAPSALLPEKPFLYRCPRGDGGSNGSYISTVSFSVPLAFIQRAGSGFLLGRNKQRESNSDFKKRKHEKANLDGSEIGEWCFL